MAVPDPYGVPWEGVDARGHRVAGGAYVVELRKEGKRALQKVALVK